MKVKLLTVVSLAIGISSDRETKAGERCDFVVAGPHKVRITATPQSMDGWQQATPTSQGCTSIALAGSLAIGRTFAPSMQPNDLVDILVNLTMV